MARARTEDPVRRRLLAAWEPPPETGEPVGLLATTFTLDTALFEEECLARFAGVQSDPDRDGELYRIEREEKLAKVLAATVVADVRHCAGRRSLRWDLLAARPASGVMHAKISLLAWARRVRIIVASANLTEPGYRSNQECFTVMEFDKTEADRSLLDPLLAFLRDILAITSGPGRARAERLLEWVGRNMAHTGPPSRGMRRYPVLVGPDRDSLFKQLDEVLSRKLAHEAHVVSPFFDLELRDGGPERALWNMLRQRGAAKAHFHVAGETMPETGGWRLEAPGHLREATPFGRSGVRTLLHPVPVRAVQTETGPENRALHAKSLLLEHEDWALLCLGSSNFTSAGTGLGKVKNFEANIAYFLRGDDSDRARKALRSRRVRGGDAVDSKVPLDFHPSIDIEGEAGDGPPPLPGFFDQALLTEKRAEGYVLNLKFAAKPAKGDWAVFEGEFMLDRKAWEERGEPTELEVVLPGARPPPSLLSVRWQSSAGENHEGDWPVNAQSPTVLPAPEELQGLSLNALLELLGSARPLSEALRLWLRRQPDDDEAARETVELIDPHAKVDTSGFLMKRMQSACWAMESLGARLAEPVLSTQAMAWRLHGPVGAQAVVDAMCRQSDPNLPDEQAFLLSELLGVLQGVQPNGCADDAVHEECTRMLKDFKASVQQRLDAATAACSASVKAYIQRSKHSSEVLHA